MNCRNIVMKYQNLTLDGRLFEKCDFLPEIRRVNFLLLIVFNFLKNDHLGRLYKN